MKKKTAPVEPLEDEVAVLGGFINMYEAEYHRIMGFRDPRLWPVHKEIRQL